jgi:Mce-associated membrane protein
VSDEQLDLDLPDVSQASGTSGTSGGSPELLPLAAPPPRPERAAWRAPLLSVLATLLAVALAAGAYLVVRSVLHSRRVATRANAAESLRTEAVTAARQFSVDFSSYDYRRIDANVSRVTAEVRGRFAADYTSNMRKLKPLFVQFKAVATAQVISAGLVSLTGDKAVVLLALDQTVVNANTPKGRIDRNRIVATVQKIQGKWYLIDLQAK